jgi:SAM-dependent methyltransferase
MLSGDLYNEQIARYEFASDYVSKRILNITNFRFLEYFSSKLLLEKNVTEIVSWYKNEGNSEYTLRWKNKENSIKFEIVNENNVFKENSFDGVILFETIQHEENQKEMLKRIYKLLKNDGILIISTTNKKSSHGIYNMTKNKINKELDKEELLELLKEVFSKVDLFTQNILNYKQENKQKKENNEKKSNKIRGLIHQVRLNIFTGLRMYNVYRSFFSDTISSKTKKEIENYTLNIQNTKYFPKPHVNDEQPLFFVAVCHK